MFLFVFSFNYEFVQGVYQQLLSANNVFVFVSGVKGLALCFLLINWYGKYFKSMEELEPGKAAKPPIKPSDIINGILLMALVGAYDQVLTILDSLLGGLEAQFLLLDVQPKPIDIGGMDVTKSTNAQDSTSSLNSMASVLVEMATDPFYFVLKAIEAIFWLLDLMIFGVFVAERFFFLGVLRVLGSIAIACVILPKTEKWFYSWLGYYVAMYLVIIPFFLINAFTNGLYAAAEQKINPYNDPTVPDSLPLAIILIFIVLVKFKLFKKANDVVFKIFS